MQTATGYKRLIVATLARIAVVFVALVVTAAAYRSELAAWESKFISEDMTMQTFQLTPTIRSHAKQRVIGRRVNLKARTRKLESGQVVIMLQKSDNVLYGPALSETAEIRKD
jgi:hypothetical protein